MFTALLTNNKVLDRYSCTVTGRTCLVTSPIWSHIDWLASSKIRIAGLRFAKLEMDKTVHLKLYLLLSGVWQEEMSTSVEH